MSILFTEIMLTLTTWHCPFQQTDMRLIWNVCVIRILGSEMLTCQVSVVCRNEQWQKCSGEMYVVVSCLNQLFCSSLVFQSETQTNYFLVMGLPKASSCMYCTAVLVCVKKGWSLERQHSHLNPSCSIPYCQINHYRSRDQEGYERERRRDEENKRERKRCGWIDTV